MEFLKDFSSKDMIEQITLLDEIKERHQLEAIGPLFELHAHPLGDQAVDEMIYHCLFELLAGQEGQIITGLGNPAPAVQLLCVRRITDGDSDALKTALLQLLNATTSNEVIAETIRALVSFKDPALVDSLLPYLNHDDCTVVGGAMHGLTETKSPKVRAVLMDIVRRSEEIKKESMGCALLTALAVENLARFTDQETIDFLVGFIHHANPSFRRVVIDTLARSGEEVLDALERRLEGGDKDEKIMAVNIIGMSGLKQGADLLVDQLEKTTDNNLKFAIYEALGRIPCMRSVVCLIDGLAEQEELVLIAVITALDHQSNPGVIKKLEGLLELADAQADRVRDALITSHATILFTALYKNGRHKETLLAAIRACGDQEVAAAFRAALEKLGDDQARQDARHLVFEGEKSGGKRLLAADDSKAMLFFYKAVAKDMGMDLVAVEDGKLALDHLLRDSNFDLIITDMNMPNMDGIELTREIKNRPEWQALPILMATTESESSQTNLASQAGVTAFISKPFSKEAFKDRINQLLP
jgi:CheY-like chemotaxis protein